jgi:hypothetical protein
VNDRCESGNYNLSFNLRNLKNLGNQIAVSIPKDDDGFMGRECPEKECEGYFKIKPGTGLTGEGLPCHCPYCGYAGPMNEFWTKEQIEYAKSVAFRQVSDAFVRDLKGLEFDHRPRGGLGIGVSMKLKPGTPPPIHYYREKALETHVTCVKCTLEYAVYGVFAYCPDCGVHNSVQMLQKNFALARRQLALAEAQTDVDFQRYLIEDALENCVSAFDGFARERARTFSTRSSDPTAAESLRFQNLRRSAARLKAVFGIDLQNGTRPEDWEFAHTCFMRRHVLAHAAGVIDQDYLDETSEGGHLLGRRLVVAAPDVDRFAAILEQLGTTLAGAFEALPRHP